MDINSAISQHSKAKEFIDKDGFICYRYPHKLTISKHRYLYQVYHKRELTKNEVVIFLNGDNRDFDIDNLYCVTRAELVQLNLNGLITSNREETLNNILIIRIKAKRIELANKIGLTDKNGNITEDKREANKRYYYKNREKEIKRVTNAHKKNI